MTSVLTASKKHTFQADTRAKATVRRCQLTLKEGELNRVVDYCKKTTVEATKLSQMKFARTIIAPLDDKVIMGKKKGTPLNSY